MKPFGVTPFAIVRVKYRSMLWYSTSRLRALSEKAWCRSELYEHLNRGCQLINHTELPA